MIDATGSRVSVEMLQSTVAFRAIQTDSRSRGHPSLLLRYRGNGLERTRYGISTSRRLGTAVVRNRQRRRLRAILGQLAPKIRPGFDVLLVVRPAAANSAQAELQSALAGLMRSAGLVVEQ